MTATETIIPTFADLGLPIPLVEALHDRGITTPFPIQALTIPDGVAGRDVCGKAKTGSGKTLAFGLPLLARAGTAAPHRPRALVLVPTRELALQVAEVLEPLGHGRRPSASSPSTAAPAWTARSRPCAEGADVVVATPGRLIDLIDRDAVSLGDIELLVLDEADRMADMGFLPQVEWLLRHITGAHQTLLFSATLDGAVDHAGPQRHLNDPVLHEVASRHDHRRGDGAPLPARPRDGQGEGRRRDRPPPPADAGLRAAPSGAPTGWPIALKKEGVRRGGHPRRPPPAAAGAGAERRSPTGACRCWSPPTSRPGASTSTTSTSSSTTTRPRTRRPTSTGRAAPPAPASPASWSRSCCGTRSSRCAGCSAGWPSACPIVRDVLERSAARRPHRMGAAGPRGRRRELGNRFFVAGRRFASPGSYSLRSTIGAPAARRRTAKPDAAADRLGFRRRAPLRFARLLLAPLDNRCSGGPAAHGKAGRRR